MTTDEIKACLQEIEQSKRYLDNLAQTITYYRSSIESPPISFKAVERVQTTPVNHLEKVMEKLLELEKRYAKHSKIILDRIAHLYECLDELDYLEKNIIIEKYLFGKKWADLEKSMDYCERQLRRKRDKALLELQRKIDF